MTFADEKTGKVWTLAAGSQGGHLRALHRGIATAHQYLTRGSEHFGHCVTGCTRAHGVLRVPAHRIRDRQCLHAEGNVPIASSHWQVA